MCLEAWVGFIISLYSVTFEQIFDFTVLNCGKWTFLELSLTLLSYHTPFVAAFHHLNCATETKFDHSACFTYEHTHEKQESWECYLKENHNQTNDKVALI